MSPSIQLIVLKLDGRSYALHLAVVDQVVRMVEVTPLPGAPEIVDGIINVQGRIIPVVNMRKRFGFGLRAVSNTDHIVIARTTRRPVALVVDAVSGVLEYSGQEAVAAQDVLPDLEHIEGVVKFSDGLILIHDLDKFLSLEEETALEQAMEND